MLDRCDVGASPLPPLMAAAHPPRTRALSDPNQARRSVRNKNAASAAAAVCAAVAAEAVASAAAAAAKAAVAAAAAAKAATKAAAKAAKKLAAKAEVVAAVMQNDLHEMRLERPSEFSVEKHRQRDSVLMIENSLLTSLTLDIGPTFDIGPVSLCGLLDSVQLIVFVGPLLCKDRFRLTKDTQIRGPLQND